MDTAKQFIADLRSSDVETRIAAANELMICGCDASDVAHEALFALADDDEEVRELLVGLFEEIRDPAAAALPTLIVQCKSEHPLVAYWALTLLGRLAPESTEAASVCQAVAANSAGDGSVRARAQWALDKLA